MSELLAFWERDSGVHPVRRRTQCIKINKKQSKSTIHYRLLLRMKDNQSVDIRSLAHQEQTMSFAEALNDYMETYGIKASVKFQNPKKKVLAHSAKLRYYSDNEEFVLSVNIANIVNCLKAWISKALKSKQYLHLCLSRFAEIL